MGKIFFLNDLAGFCVRLPLILAFYIKYSGWTITYTPGGYH
jgi:hypothetical protein